MSKPEQNRQKLPNLPEKLRQNLAEYYAVNPRCVSRWAKQLKPFSLGKFYRFISNVKNKNNTQQQRTTSPSHLDDLREMFAAVGMEDDIEPQSAVISSEGEPQTLDEARLQKIRLETQRIQLGLDRDRGEVVSRKALREAGVRIGAALAAAVAALDNDLPGLLAGKSEQEIRLAVTPRLARMQEQFNESLAEVVE